MSKVALPSAVILGREFTLTENLWTSLLSDLALATRGEMSPTRIWPAYVERFSQGYYLGRRA